VRLSGTVWNFFGVKIKKKHKKEAIMTESKPKSFIIYEDFESILLKLSMKERGMLFTMAFSYAKRGEIEIESTPLVDMAFTMLRTQIDRDREKYETICKRNAENGKKGGRPRKPKESERFSYKPKKADNDNEKESDIDIDIDNDNEFPVGRSFDPEDFFNAALRRTFSDKD